MPFISCIVQKHTGQRINHKRHKRNLRIEHIFYTCFVSKKTYMPFISCMVQESIKDKECPIQARP